jgi:hypothetical protein
MRMAGSGFDAVLSSRPSRAAARGGRSIDLSISRSIQPEPAHVGG